jgi:hypothetical protein
MTALPETATLTPETARQLLRDIRGEWRPQLLGQLGRSYRSYDGGASSQAEILAGEIRLQKLDQYLVSLLAILGRAGGPLGWDSFRPPIRDLRQFGSDSVEADVELAFSPENHECVHGPCTLVPVDRLANKLLLPGERVTVVERVTWTIPLRHRVRLRLWDATTPEPALDRDAAVSGRLSTSLGRAFEFAGIPLAAYPLLTQRDYSVLSQALVAGTKLVSPQPNTLTLDLADQGLAACRRAVRHRSSLCAALVLDVVPIAILNWKRGRPMMACGYRDVPLPASPAVAFADGTRLELRSRADRSHRSSRSGLWIAYYEFRYVPRQTDWSTMVMAEADDVATLLRKIHS